MMDASSPILPPSMLGILGGGQLGMLFTIAAQSMGYQVTVLDPNADSPAAHFADVYLCEDFNSLTAWEQLARTCQALTIEFENVSVEALRWLEKKLPVHPSADCVAIAQERIAEKRFLQKIGFTTVPFLAIDTSSALNTDLTAYLPGILKIARLGYDGKGQKVVNTIDETRAAYTEFQCQPCVLEKKCTLKAEISVTAIRSVAGEVATFPPAENQHINGILDISIVPARVNPILLRKATDLTSALIEELHYVGVLTVEFFVLATDELVVNEIAPRPHNSAHYTLDATLSSQFEQQVRVLCGLAPAATTLRQPCVMVNLLGEHWQQHTPNWEAILNASNVKLHLYRKRQARPGRKMGHYTVLHDNVNEALRHAKILKETL